MATYDQVTDALGASIRAFDSSFQTDVNLFNYQPRTVVPPCAIIKPQAHRTIDYVTGQSNSLTAKWHFLVMLVIGEIDERSAQAEAGALVSPGSPLINAIKATRFATSGFAVVTQGAVSQMAVKTRDGGEALYTYAQLSVLIET